MLNRRLYRFRALILLLSLSLVSGMVALAEDTAPTDPRPAESGPTEPDDTDSDQTALEGLLRTVKGAEGVSERSKHQLQDRLLRLSERLNRFGPGIDQEAAIVAELEALRDDHAELTLLIDAILAAYEAGHSFDAIVSIVSGPDTEPDDPTLARVAQIAFEAELAEEENDALLAALQTEAEPPGELNRGRIVSTMAHMRNLDRKARRDGVELTAEQLTALVKEGLSGHLSEDEIKTITEAALNSDRGMSEAEGHIKHAVSPKGKGRQNTSDREPSEDVESPPKDDDSSSQDSNEGDGGDAALVAGKEKGRPAAAAAQGKSKGKKK